MEHLSVTNTVIVTIEHCTYEEYFITFVFQGLGAFFATAKSPIWGSIFCTK